MKGPQHLIFIILTCCWLQVVGQNRVIDSLKQVLKTGQGDTNNVKTLNALSLEYETLSSYDSSLVYSKKAIELSEKLSYERGLAIAYNIIGFVYDDKGNFSKTLEYLTQSEKIFEELHDNTHVAKLKGNIGNTYNVQGDYPKALEYYLAALDMFTRMGDKKGIATIEGNIGNVYTLESDYAQALEHDTKALELYRQLGSKVGIARNTANIGQIYLYKKDYNNARKYFLDALNMETTIGRTKGILMNLKNMGALNLELKKYDSAKGYYMRALEIANRIEDKPLISLILGQIGAIYKDEKNYTEAEKYLLQALAIDTSLGRYEGISSVSENLSELYAADGKWQNAYLSHIKYSNAKDTLLNKDKSKQLGKLEAKAEYDKKLMEDDKRAALASAENKKQRILILFVGIIALSVAFLSVIIFRSLRITRKQKGLIESQKVLVEEKNKEIVDSITYAKRLQDAILPPLSLVKQYFPESFLFYKPKDIVAGDFYWMERAGDNILIAAADCTGHGVPGAMVSVVCSNALNRTVKEFKITEPGKILDKVRELVLETFEKSQDNVQDGMDISLCCINTATKVAQWSGAYNSLWYIRNGDIIEVPADKQPIGKVDKPIPFNTHNLNLQKGDTLFLFSDGYADQFGGPKGKKFKYKQLQELLLANAGKSMEEQKKALEDVLNHWKGNLEQVDDILVIGVKM